MAEFHNRTNARVIAWNNDGQALVVDKAAGRLVPAAQFEGFEGLEVDDHIVAALPGDGWMGEFRSGGSTFHEPVIGWRVLHLGIGDPFFGDDQGYFEHAPTPELVLSSARACGETAA
ncbi:hypothetical protein [Frankia sp. EAN1pec]|uniref:hypothetical protein n=1 Tax=Parafrankia sp. (strain EAN1pec) TaxID=298653 RepID=UPI00059BEC72